MRRSLAVSAAALAVAAAGCVNRAPKVPPRVTPHAVVPRPTPGLPIPTRVDCHYADAGGGVNPSLTVDVLSARGTTCGQAKRVFKATSDWLDPNDYEHLGVRRHPVTLGWRCEVKLVGDSDWHVDCYRGRRTIVGDTSE
jgi:hypothetical protein